MSRFGGGMNEKASTLGLEEELWVGSDRWKGGFEDKCAMPSKASSLLRTKN